jgi:CRISPR/Cas system Type II protein with McrA/HNH and RuvC-like nuclease domain
MDQVLVLNSDFTPHNVTTLRRGFILVEKGKAEVLHKGEDIVTTVGNFVRPLIIRLLNYVKFRPKGIGVTRKRIFKRDNNTCCYCGSQRNLTIDHIIPKSRGGNNSWDNLVTSCFRCNSKKDNKTPEEAGMKMKYKPSVPNLFSRVIDETVENTWQLFQGSFFNSK